VPVAKRIVGRKMMAKSTPHSLKVQLRGVMAGHLRQLHPLGAATDLRNERLRLPKLSDTAFLGPKSSENSARRAVVRDPYIAAIIFFAYFYISISSVPTTSPTTCAKYGGFSQASVTANAHAAHHRTCSHRITLVGAAVTSSVISINPHHA